MDWLSALGWMSCLNEEPRVYLLPLFSTDEERDEILALVKPTVTFKECEAWSEDVDLYPRFKNEAEFDAWFECRVTEGVLDLVEGEVGRELG